MQAPTATSADDDELGTSHRTIARRALLHRTFRQSQYLRQDKVRALRAIIAEDGADDDPADRGINSNSGNNDRVGGGTSGRPLPAGQELGTRMSSAAARTTATLSETKGADHEDNRGQAQDEKEDLVHIPDESAYVAASTQLVPPVSAAGATLAAEGATRHASGVAGDHGIRSNGDDNGRSQAHDDTATVELNKYLWRLEEKRHPLGGCDTSVPPIRDNQGEAGQPYQQQSWASRDATTKVLSARDVMDRRSLLEYAAALGKASHFEDLALWLRWKLGVGGLVNQLREPGVDGAPLLFQAVNIDECFKAVTKVLLDTLGAGGVAQQIRATDQKGMTLLMHVARFAGSVEVFSSALHLVKTLTSRQQGLCHLRARDAEGRTLVHHAAEGRTEEMLPKVMEVVSRADLWVIDESDSESTDLRQYLSTRTDRHGRSPALCALGRKGNPRASLEKSIDVLLAGAPPSGSTALVNNGADAAEGNLPVPAASPALSHRLRLMFQAPEGGGGKGGRGNSPLCWVLHAARGGIEAFNLAYDGIRGQEEKSNRRSDLDLVKALAFGFPSSPPFTPEEFDKRCAKLFAQAALGGDRAVLERVASGLCSGAIPSDKRERYWAIKADYPLDPPDFLRAAHQADRMSAEDYTKKHHGFVEDESVGVGAAIIPGASATTAGSGSTDVGLVGEATDSADKGGQNNKLKGSLFALTILSGSKEAVRWAAKFVRDNSSNADEAWNVLCGINGKDSNVSSLTYATAASSNKDDKDDGVFEAVCQALQKAAITKCNSVAGGDGSDGVAGDSVHLRAEAADKLFREELLLRMPSKPVSPSRAADETDITGGGGETKMEEGQTPNADAASMRRHFTPLAGAVFCGNADMFKKVLHAYKEGAHGGSNTGGGGGTNTPVGFPESEIIAQTAAVLSNHTYKSKETDEDSGPMAAYESGPGDGGTEMVPPEVRLLLRGCCGPEAMQEVVDEVGSGQFSKAVEQAEWIDSLSTAKQAAAEGTFDGLRALIEKGWNCHAHLATLIGDIGDAEEQVIATVMCAVENSSNPFVTSAIASVCMAKHGRDCSKDRLGLARLQEEIDQFTTELLGKLPQTVKGVGLELISSFEQPDLGKNDEPDGEEEPATEAELARRKNIMANHVGYIAVVVHCLILDWEGGGIKDIKQIAIASQQALDEKAFALCSVLGACRWMLEPSLNSGPKDKQSWLVSKMISATLQDLDPLQQALTKGSDAHDFINAPLVLDYLELKWKCTTPNLDRRNPLDYTINEGFSTYRSGNGKYTLPEKGVDIGDTFLERGGTTAEESLLRLLQGWDRGPTRVLRFKEKHLLHGFPHTTVLPGTQFLLAGLLGKPTDFFLVPFVRFMFETFSYLVMLGLYWSSVAIQYSDIIPADEILFYLFAAGLLFREILEFRDALPPSVSSSSSPTSSPSDATMSSDDGEDHGSSEPDSLAARAREERSGLSQRRVTSGLRRYFSKDNWNILDTASIFCVMLAFIFRIIAYIADFAQAATTILGNTLIGQAFFIARFSLAAIAPLLFARVLSLAQVDNTFGPMTQIIWNMLFHLARFSVFMLVVMVSFALAFHSLYSDPNCSEGDELFESYRTLRESLLDMFRSMLGDANFDRFEADRNLTCTGPSWEFDAGITLLTIYIVLQAILMLNLLIAVLSTVHDTVSENAITEFHLARSQFIQASAASVEGGRLPPPLNLLMAAILIVVDVFGEICHWVGKSLRFLSGCGKARPVASSAAVPASGGAGSDPRRRPEERKGPGMISARDVDPVMPGAAAGFTAPAAAPAFDASEDEVKGESGPGVGGGGNILVGNNAKAASSEASRDSGDGLVPMTEWPIAKRAVGGLERLLFALTMGPVALALSSVLWAISIPSLAGRIVRWMLAVADRKPKLRSRRAGYFRKLCSGIVGPLGLVVGLSLALVLVVVSLLGSVLLWFRGLYEVFEWLTQPIEQDGSESDPCHVSLVGKGAILPGALRARKGGWQDAIRVVEASNYGPIAQRKRTIVGGPVPGHYDVGALLQMTTGWTLGHLSSLVRMKEEESRKEESMLREIDDERSRIEAADAAETEYGRRGGNGKRVSFYEN